MMASSSLVILQESVFQFYYTGEFHFSGLPEQILLEMDAFYIK